MASFPRRVVATSAGAISVHSLGGKGQSLLLLHGIGGNADAWRRQYSAFGRTFRVTAWDAPGYGMSADLAQEAPSVEDYAATVVALLDALDIERTVLLGHSLGGLIAACVAAQHPERVSRLVLTACSSGHASYDKDKRESILRARLQAFAEGEPLAYARARVPNVLSPDASTEVFEEAVSIMSQIRRPGFLQATRMVSAADVFPYLTRIDAPTRVICGSLDQVTHVDLNRKIAQSIRGADFVEIQGAGHWLFLEFPDQFNSAVAQFIQ